MEKRLFCQGERRRSVDKKDRTSSLVCEHEEQKHIQGYPKCYKTWCISAYCQSQINGQLKKTLLYIAHNICKQPRWTCWCFCWIRMKPQCEGDMSCSFSELGISLSASSLVQFMTDIGQFLSVPSHTEWLNSNTVWPQICNNSHLCKYNHLHSGSQALSSCTQALSQIEAEHS